MSVFVGFRGGLARSIMRRLLLLDRSVPTYTDAEIEQEVRRNYRWNFTVNLIDGATFFFGLSFVSSSTIMPLFISKLTDSPLLIGLVAAMAQAGWFLPQLFTAGYIERLPRKKPVVANLGFFTERLPIFLWPLVVLMAPQRPSLALLLFFLTYAWHGLGAGAVGPAWQDMIASIFPVNRRGRFFGTTSFVGTGLGALGAFLSSWILKSYPFPTSFVILFSVAAAAIFVSWIFLEMAREPARSVEPSRGKGRFRAKLLRVWQRDHNFRTYLVARLLLTLGTMGMGFLTVAALRHWNVSDATVGMYTAALLFGQTAGNLAAGLVADRFGHKLSLELGALTGVLAFFLAWQAPAPVWYYVVFFLVGIFMGSFMVAGMLITLEFTQPAHRPTYIGMANTTKGIGSGLAPLLGAWIATTHSYNSLFAVGTLTILVSFVLLRWGVTDPRKRAFDLNRDMVLEAVEN